MCNESLVLQTKSFMSDLVPSKVSMKKERRKSEKNLGERTNTYMNLRDRNAAKEMHNKRDDPNLLGRFHVMAWEGGLQSGQTARWIEMN